MSTIISTELQLCLIAGSIGVYIYIIYKIRKANVRIDDMIIWILGSILLLLLSIFPIIPSKLAEITGFMTAANFIFTSVILFLMLILFTQAVKISQQQEKLKDITHKLAMLEKDIKEKNLQ